MKNKLKNRFYIIGVYCCHSGYLRLNLSSESPALRRFAHTVCRTDRLRSLPSPTPDGSQITKEPEIAL